MMQCTNGKVDNLECMVLVHCTIILEHVIKTMTLTRFTNEVDYNSLNADFCSNQPSKTFSIFLSLKFNSNLLVCHLAQDERRY